MEHISDNTATVIVLVALFAAIAIPCTIARFLTYRETIKHGYKPKEVDCCRECGAIAPGHIEATQAYNDTLNKRMNNA